MFELNDKVALVTGGSRGIGRATAEALAAQGAQVVIGYVSQRGRRARDRHGDRRARRQGRDSRARRRRLGAATEKLIGEAAKRLGRLDILVANAGISIDGLLLRLKDEDLDRILAVNVKGALACARAAIKVMMRAKTGRIVFLSSVVGEMGNAGQTAYAASKAALLGVTKLARARVRLARTSPSTRSSPGFIDTDMTRSLTDEQQKAMLAARPARPHRHGARGGGVHRVPRVRRGGLRHRADAARERRHVRLIFRRSALRTERNFANSPNYDTS